MKKIITSALVILATATGFSQEVKWGVKGGINSSSLLDGEDIVAEGDEMRGSNSSKIGFHIGGFMEYKINDKVAIQPELTISTQGANFENYFAQNDDYAGNFQTHISQKVSLTNINIPIILKYQVIDKLNLEFGPQLGMIISANNTLDYTITGGRYATKEFYKIGFQDKTYKLNSRDFYIFKKMNRFDLGLNIGASYDITDNLFVQARYNFGLTGINIISVSYFDAYNPDHGEKDNYIARNEVRNSVFQLSLGYKF